jgi:small ubiquitin-related modifier
LAVDDPLPSIPSSLSDARAILETLGYRLDPNFQTIFSDLLDHKIPPPGAKASSLLKLVKYTGRGDALSLPEHIDRGLITILVSDADGLEVWDSVDEDWVGIAANSPVLLIGHTLEAASGGAFKATRHRVKTKKPRLSVGLLIRGRGDAILKPQNVPKGKRTSEGMRLVDEEGMEVKELMTNFAESHKSVTGKAAGESSSSAKRGASSSNTESDNADAKRTRVPSGGFTHLRLKDQTGGLHDFRIRGTTSLGEVFKEFAIRTGARVEDFRFLFDGEVLRREATPDSMEMRDDDVIFVIPFIISNGFINLRLKFYTGRDTYFKVNRTTKLGLLFDKYATKMGIERSSIRFRFVGEAIRREDTPDTMKMEDDDKIDCFLEQTGD